MPVSQRFRWRMLDKLRLLYAEQADDVLRRVDVLTDRYAGLRRRDHSPLWDQRSVMLITYGDQITSADRSSLEAQRRFLLDFDVPQVIDTVHILPFFPYTSDDGFSVVDYRQMDPRVGDWSGVSHLGDSFELAFDFVMNHCSRQNDWFQRYLRGESPYDRYFIDADPATDLSAVTRPRSSPLLTPFQTARGTKHVWTTFSADQIDLNYACPEVLLEALDILLFYIQQGAKIVRLDAVGFLWKRIGTSCMHLPETHAVIQLMRDLVEDLAPSTVLLTETNVPHQENISYFADGNEAHAVYQFSLAPLLLDAMMTGDAGLLNTWLAGLEFPGNGMTFLNFTASHDGVGLRPLEGLLSPDRLDRLIAGVRQRGGLVSMRQKPDGSESPYELNIAYVSALDSPEGLPPELLSRKFLTAQGLMLALRGVPGVYFHSLVGTRNYIAGVEQTGHPRSINRRKFAGSELRQILDTEGSLERRIFDGYRRMLAVRIAQPAFHPDAPQAVLDSDHQSVVALLRTSVDGDQRILVLANLAGESVSVDLGKLGVEASRDLLRHKTMESRTYELAGYGIAWLA